MDIPRAKKYYEHRLTTIEAWRKVADENGIILTECQNGQAKGIHCAIVEFLEMLNEEDE